MTNNFRDLQPTETDATGIVGGSFLGFGPTVVPLPGGASITLFGNVD
ncbi:hypothetical protein ABIE44_003350 [Marmoricola sp. OAE513]